MSIENMKLWDSVAKTDPAHTNKVNQRGGFTAIDAHYQVQQATQTFGPVGEGWGYEATHTVEHLSAQDTGIEVAIADVIVWHGDRDKAYGPVRGMTEVINQKGRVDMDAPKKALTDALTKALSHLGFSADVFLGKFDDNKYVQQIKKEFAQEAMPPRAKKILEAIKDIESAEQMDAAKRNFGDDVKKIMAEAPAAGQMISSAIRNKMNSFNKENDNA